MGLKKEQENEFAKALYLNSNLTQKEIAERVGVQENTITKWIKEGGWDKLKKSLLVTKSAQLSRLYEQLEWQNHHIATRRVTYDIPDYLLKPTKLKDADGSERLHYPVYEETDYPILLGNVASAKEADAISKLTAAINRLETETSVGQVMEVGMEFIEFIRPLDLNLAKQVTKLFDIFIKDKMQ